MSFAWFPPRGTPGPWVQPWGYPVMRPVYRPLFTVGYPFREPALMETDGPGGPVPPGVQVIADVRAGHISDFGLPSSAMAWSPDGRYLLYNGFAAPDSPEEALMLLDMANPASPRPVVEQPTFDGVAWHPDGQSFAYTGMYEHPERRSWPTIYQKRLVDAEPVNLLADITPLKVGFIHRWLDDQTLAFDEGVGTGIRRVLLLDTAQGKLTETPGMVGSYFTWSAPGNRVAGEYYAWPPPEEASFWLWDRPTRQFLLSPLPEERPPLPANHQFFEAWSPDGRAALFTAWYQLPYEPGTTPTLYRFDPETGRTDQVAERAALAAWSGDWIAYVRWGPRLTLVVARAADGQVLWTDDMGPFPGPEGMENPGLFGQVFPWTYWPRFGGPYVAYRTSAGEWRVSPAERKDVRPIYRGEFVDLEWSPDGSRIALLHTNETARLTVVANPLGPQTGRSTPTEGAPAQEVEERVGAIIRTPEGMTLEEVFSTQGNEVCMLGQAKVEAIMPPIVTPGTTPIPQVAVTLQVGDYKFILEPGTEAEVGSLVAAARAKLVQVCGLTLGLHPLYGPRVRVGSIMVLEQ